MFWIYHDYRNPGYCWVAKVQTTDNFLKKYTWQFIILSKNCEHFLTTLMIYVIEFELCKSVKNITGGVHTHLAGEQY